MSRTPSLVDISCDATVYGDVATMYQAVVVARYVVVAYGAADAADAAAVVALENANLLTQLSTCEKPSLA